MTIRLLGLAYIKTIKLCANILRLMKRLSTQQKNQSRNFNGVALELAASSSLHPIGWRRVTGQQNIAAHIKTIKKRTARMRFFFSTGNSGLEDNIQHAVNKEAPAATSSFTIRNLPSLPGLPVPAYI